MNKPKICSFVPMGLIALSAVPVLAGLARLREIGIGKLTVENVRFLMAPTPVVLHIIAASLFGLLGALQFAAGFRQRFPRWHRIAGRILVPCGLVVSLSGLWMTQFYPSTGFDGPALYWVRLLVGIGMTSALVLGVVAIPRRDFQAHEAWMVRAYALGMGAGTQVLTHIPWFLFPGIQGELARTVLMTAGWGINLWVAERVVLRSRPRSPDPTLETLSARGGRMLELRQQLDG